MEELLKQLAGNSSRQSPEEIEDEKEKYRNWRENSQGLTVPEARKRMEAFSDALLVLQKEHKIPNFVGSFSVVIADDVKGWSIQSGIHCSGDRMACEGLAHQLVKRL